jgi:ubiquinone/menaquinone biosynthesis C-methylase UbiE
MEWFEEWFGEDYLQLYPHRDDADADRAVALICRTVRLQPGWRVLDVACGAGRHARAFVAAGARCVGLDLSATLLRLARQVTDAPLVRADMRQLAIRPASMDLTVNLFTSFGYFERDAEHTAALEEMVSTVRPGGWFVIDFLNPAAVRRRLVPSHPTAATSARAFGRQRVDITRNGCACSSPIRSPACSRRRG